MGPAKPGERPIFAFSKGEMQQSAAELRFRGFWVSGAHARGAPLGALGAWKGSAGAAPTTSSGWPRCPLGVVRPGRRPVCVRPWPHRKPTLLRERVGRQRRGVDCVSVTDPRRRERPLGRDRRRTGPAPPMTTVRLPPPSHILGQGRVRCGGVRSGSPF